MLEMRPDHMKAFEESAIRGFENRMVDHVGQFFPRHLAVLGEPAIRAVIRLGVTRGEAYGFDTEHDLCLYINLMLLLGSLFDEDPQLAWADAILHDTSIPDGAARAERLHDEAMKFHDAAAGEEGEHLTRTLVTLHKHPVKETWRPGPGTLEDRLLAYLRALWPRKCEQVGAGPLGLIIHRGIQAAERHRLAGEFGGALYVVLTFVLGSGFEADPQHPWAAAALQETSASARAGKADLLHGGFMALLAAWLA